jgi:hypothetical protein
MTAQHHTGQAASINLNQPCQSVQDTICIREKSDISITRFKQTRQSDPLVSVTRDIPSIREARMRIPGFRYEDCFTSTSGLCYGDLIHDERTT